MRRAAGWRRLGAAMRKGTGLAPAPRALPRSRLGNGRRATRMAFFRSFLLLLIMPGFYTCFGLSSELFNGGLQLWDDSDKFCHFPFVYILLAEF